ncbi:hypothetical protein DCC39_11610 [Pueribacillus theae]|uniref:Zinc-finger domain-containing protein n=1 Tax=Pueribacillus theae TaxID=2171751 RepID=A0A2U1K005_9BACI|nr:hypothetical protein [Pueribacillus theae]PWA10353.1 hypothetical protein DCC39_11610 [Pueribacillus theae]
MSHFQYEDWMNYVEEKIDEKARATYENHLYDCSQCLELYIKAVEAHEQSFPNIIDENFTNSVIEKIPLKDHNAKPRVNNRKSLFQSSVFHYFIAAAITLMLMSSGLFAQLTQIASNFEEKVEKEHHQPLTEELMKKTLTWIPDIEKTKEAKRR